MISNHMYRRSNKRNIPESHEDGVGRADLRPHRGTKSSHNLVTTEEVHPDDENP